MFDQTFAIKGDMDDEKEEEGEQFEKDAKLEARPFKKVALDEEAIVATALVIMVAGYDTTGIKYCIIHE